jgi:hypothetical protein
MVENPTYLNIDFIPKDPFFDPPQNLQASFLLTDQLLDFHISVGDVRSGMTVLHWEAIFIPCFFSMTPVLMRMG